MITSLIIIFVIAYAAIALEHPININKSASALLGAGLLWTVYAIATNDHHLVDHQLSESLASTAQIMLKQITFNICTWPKAEYQQYVSYKEEICNSTSKT